MKKEVLIVEDKKIESQALAELVKEIDSKCDVYEAKDENEAYAIAMKNTIDVFLVDIILHPEKTGDHSGIDFVQNIRTVDKYKFTPIVIITSLYDSRMSIFSSVRYYSFVEKPFDFTKVRNIIKEAMQYETRNDENRKYIFHVDGLLQSVEIQKILYITSKGHRLQVVTKDDCFFIPYKSCKTMLQELDSPAFARCNRGTIVNMNLIDKVDSVNRFIYMRDAKETIEIGTGMKKAFMEQFCKYYKS